VSDTPQDRARVRLANGVCEIERALRDWQSQASDAIGAWDGEGFGPSFYAEGIVCEIAERTDAITGDTERMLRNG